MKDKFLHVYEMAEVAEHNLWGMILWPEWEKRNGFQQSLWKLLQEEYADSVDEYRLEMQRVLLKRSLPEQRKMNELNEAPKTQ